MWRARSIPSTVVRLDSTPMVGLDGALYEFLNVVAAADNIAANFTDRPARYLRIRTIEISVSAIDVARLTLDSEFR